jgi:hypothetical protein
MLCVGAIDTKMKKFSAVGDWREIDSEVRWIKRK